MSANGSVEKIASIDVQPFGVSIADNGNAIIVTCSTPLRTVVPVSGKNNKIVIFTPIGTIREVICLPDGLEIPRHTLRISRGSEYIVVHGWNNKPGQVVRVKSTRQVDVPDDLVDSGDLSPQEAQSSRDMQQGCYGSSDSSSDQSLIRPLSLCNDGDGGILVVDYYNDRIHLINHQLQFVQLVLSKTANQIQRPRHVCLNSDKGVLFVGFESGEIRAFQVRNPKSAD